MSFGPPPYLPVTPRTAGLAIAGLVVGITSFLFGWLPALGFILGAVGLALNILALRHIGRSGERGKAMATSGLILSSIAMLTAVIVAAVSVVGLLIDHADRGRDAPTSATDAACQRFLDSSLVFSNTDDLLGQCGQIYLVVTIADESINDCAIGGTWSDSMDDLQNVRNADGTDGLFDVDPCSEVGDINSDFSVIYQAEVKITGTHNYTINNDPSDVHVMPRFSLLDMEQVAVAGSDQGSSV